MRELNTIQAQQVAGGDVSVGVTANVPTADVQAFATLLGNLLVGELDAATLGNYLVDNAASFNDMTISEITIGNFTITEAVTA